MLMLESPEMIEKRSGKKLATRILKSSYDSELAVLARSGKDRSKSLESKPVSSVGTKKDRPKMRSAQAPPRLPEPENPRIIFSKPEPREFPEVENKPEGILKKMLKKISDTILDKLIDLEPESETHIYV